MKRTEQAIKKGPGWQAEKSAIMRTAILEAAIECFIDLGYANTTTAKIADYASVSRGAMMHHFPSRLEVLKAAIEYLHRKRLEEYDTLMANIDIPDKELDRETIHKSVLMAWKYVNLPSFVAYREVLSASRTDAELSEIVNPVEKDFEQQFRQHTRSMFPHWEHLGPSLELATDIVTFTTQGMALSHMVSNKNKRAARILEFITDQLLQIYLSGKDR